MRRTPPGRRARWARSTRRCASSCKSVAAELKTHGVPVRDLIDAQSFVWLSFLDAQKREAATEAEPVKAAPAPVVTENVAKDLAAATFWPQERAERLVSQVNRWGQLLFQGPPGTGKTFVAETLARLLAGDEEGRVEVVQFHPSYAYEDFIEGIRPVVTEGSDLAYEVRKGIFTGAGANEAIEYPEDPFFLVVDEINRANLPRVFGELLYALEYRGAGAHLPPPVLGRRVLRPAQHHDHRHDEHRRPVDRARRRGDPAAVSPRRVRARPARAQSVARVPRARRHRRRTPPAV